MSELKYPKCHDCAIVDCGNRAKLYPKCYIKISDAPRPAVKVFAIEMEKQLRANDHKGGWNQSPSMLLLDGLRKNHVKLKWALDRGELTEITRRAANIANFAMMIAENEGKPNTSEGDVADPVSEQPEQARWDKAITHAREMLEIYKGIPAGAFGATMIARDIANYERGDRNQELLDDLEGIS